MLLLKKIDVYGQFLLLIAALLDVLVLHTTDFIYGYFIVGGWQLLSMVIHYFYGQHKPLSSFRARYQKIIYILLMTGIGCLVLPALAATELFHGSIQNDFLVPVGFFLLFLYAAILLVGGAFLAFWYTWFSYRELDTWKQRDWVHLR